MALDSRDKRAAAYALGLSWLLVGPTPDGSIGSAADRLHVYGLGRVVAAAATSPGDSIAIGSHGGLRLRDSGDLTTRGRGGIRIRSRP